MSIQTRNTDEELDAYCECGHHSSDHSYQPLEDNINLYCDYCDCKNFKRKKYKRTSK